jgi:adenylate cyclase
MADVFVSYARSTEAQARKIADSLRAAGYDVWRDDQLPAHRPYNEVIEEQLNAAKAIVVVWSREAAKSQWVRAEADLARNAGTLVQLRVDTAALPLPFNQIECADLSEWSGDPEVLGWRKVVTSVADLVGPGPAPAAEARWKPKASRRSEKPSIAVLPFVNLSGDPEQDYFADGIVEEITTVLSRVRSIFVVAAGSSLSFKGADVRPQDAAQRLGVRYVLEGSIRKAGAQVRIAVRLIDTTDRSQIWAERFEDGVKDIFALQDRVALAVAGVIEPRVQHVELLRAASRRTGNFSSYDLCLKALSRYRTGERAAIFEALTLLDRASALDPEYAVALGLAAMCHRDIALNGWSDGGVDHRSRGIELANRALRFGSDDAEVLAFAGAVLDRLEPGNPAVATIIDRAVALNPGSATAWLSSGMMRLRNGDAERAAEHLENSMRLDPLSPVRGWQLFGLAAARFELGRFADTASLLEEAAQRLPGPAVYLLLIASYGHLGRGAEAASALARFAALGQGDIQAHLSAAPNPRQRDLCERGLALAGLSTGA